MTTRDSMMELFYRIDEELKNVEKHSQAKLYPSEAVTISFLFCLKGVGYRAFYRWLKKITLIYFHSCLKGQDISGSFCCISIWRLSLWQIQNLRGVIDAYRVVMIYPIREGRSAKQSGKKGISNHRRIVGGKLCLLLNQNGLDVARAADTEMFATTNFNHWLKSLRMKWSF